eukprot:TRINITY_DN1544_c0_g1_i1.p1 TRINITY_DN1544_c0_g1~~TRINITY_DN1544_c0_g1_i1.p1  ORF type:complete len:304 (-),score=94.30 TRINITY_DN1544_c0_g1_i1:867-1754(-)
MATPPERSVSTSTPQSSPAFRKFMRLKHYVEMMKQGGNLYKWEPGYPFVLSWFSLDSTSEWLSWTKPTPNSIRIADIEDIRVGEEKRNNNQPYFTVSTRAKSVNICTSNWREFEVWYQGLRFLSGLATEMTGLSDSLELMEEHKRINEMIAAVVKDDDDEDETTGAAAAVASSEEEKEAEAANSEPEEAEDECGCGCRREFEQELARLQEGLTQQHNIIVNLLRQNRTLLKTQRKQEATITRLLGDLKEQHKATRTLQRLQESGESDTAMGTDTLIDLVNSQEAVIHKLCGLLSQ